MAARKRFGEVCIGLGLLTREKLARALRIQKELQAGGMDPPVIGEILIREGFITAAQRDQALEAAGEIPADFLPGYEIVEVIGRGARGIVYRARQISMDRSVALKILPGTVAEDRKYSEKFTREAKSVARLNHPNIISGIDVGEHEGCHYFVMEFVDGTNLATVLRQGPMDPEEAISVAAQVGEALDHAHSHGIVHRDIKPDNIMITRDGTAKLCDYGLAAPATTGSTSERLKKVEGTPHYLSPEQARGLPDIDIRADLYSLGATFYHLLTGAPPFEGDDPAEIMRQHLSATPRPLKEVIPGLKGSVQRVMDRLLEKDREKRFQTPREFVDAITRISGRPVRAAGGRAVAAPGWGQKKRRQLVASAIIGPLLGAGLAVLLALTAPEDPRRPTPPPNPTFVTQATGPTGTSPVMPTGPDKPDPPPEVPDDLSAADREAEAAWDVVMDLAENTGRTPEETEKLIQAIEGFLEKHGDSYLKEKAQRTLTTHQLAYETLVGREFEKVEQAVEETYEKGDFLAAEKMAKAFQRKYNHPVYSLRASQLARDVVSANQKEFERVEKRAGELLGQDRLLEAESLYAKLLEKSTQEVSDRCRQKVEEIKTRKKAAENETLVASIQAGVRKAIEENDLDKALKDCDDLLSAIEDLKVREEIEVLRDRVQQMKKAFDHLGNEIDAIRGSGQEVTLLLRSGEKLEGRITEVDRKQLSFTFKVTGQKDPISLGVDEISPETVTPWIVDEEMPDKELALSGTMLFLEKGDYPLAESLYTKAQGLGRVPDWVIAGMDELKVTYMEREAARLLRKARDALSLAGQTRKAEDWQTAARIYERLLDPEQFRPTELVGAEFEKIGNEYRKCLIEIAILGGPASLLNGEVEEERGGAYSFVYDFGDEKQIEDWVVDTAFKHEGYEASRKARSKTMEVVGKVDFRVAFDGDVEVEVIAESRAIRNPNINIMLHSGAEQAYLFGLGFKPTAEWVTVQISRGDRKTPSQLVLPGNCILGYKGDVDGLKQSGLWGDHRPLIEVRKKYRIKVGHSEGMLQLGVTTRELARIPESSGGDRGGRVAFVPFGQTLRIHHVRIVGKPSPKWIEEEVSRRVDAQLEGKQ